MLVNRLTVELHVSLPSWGSNSLCPHLHLSLPLQGQLCTYRDSHRRKDFEWTTNQLLCVNPLEFKALCFSQESLAHFQWHSLQEAKVIVISRISHIWYGLAGVRAENKERIKKVWTAAVLLSVTTENHKDSWRKDQMSGPSTTWKWARGRCSVWLEQVCINLFLKVEGDLSPVFLCPALDSLNGLIDL